MRSLEERREEERRYEADVAYEVWRNNGDLECIDHERVDKNFYYGATVDEAASEEMKHQHPAHHEPIQEDAE